MALGELKVEVTSELCYSPLLTSQARLSNRLCWVKIISKYIGSGSSWGVCTLNNTLQISKFYLEKEPKPGVQASQEIRIHFHSLAVNLLCPIQKGWPSVKRGQKFEGSILMTCG